MHTLLLWVLLLSLRTCYVAVFASADVLLYLAQCKPWRKNPLMLISLYQNTYCEYHEQYVAKPQGRHCWWWWWCNYPVMVDVHPLSCFHTESLDVFPQHVLCSTISCLRYTNHTLETEMWLVCIGNTPEKYIFHL